jgi:hypothetical protein
LKPTPAMYIVISGEARNGEDIKWSGRSREVAEKMSGQ